MNFTSGAMIYHDIKNTADFIDDYRKNLDSVDRDTATSRLIQNEIKTLDIQYGEYSKQLYVLKSDFEKRQLELYNQINELKHLLKQNISQEEFDHHFPTEPPF